MQRGSNTLLYSMLCYYTYDIIYCRIYSIIYTSYVLYVHDIMLCAVSIYIAITGMCFICYYNLRGYNKEIMVYNIWYDNTISYKTYTVLINPMLSTDAIYNYAYVLYVSVYI